LSYICIAVFKPQRKEISEGYRKLHNEDFHTVHFAANVVRVSKATYKILFGKLEGRSPFEKP
jgi:hypothetical protein